MWHCFQDRLDGRRHAAGLYHGVCEVQAPKTRKAGLISAIALLGGAAVIVSAVSQAFGIAMRPARATIGAERGDFITSGPVTGAALSASSDVVAPSIATGLIKAILSDGGAPMAARWMSWITRARRWCSGGLAGTVSGVTAGTSGAGRHCVWPLTATFHRA